MPKKPIKPDRVRIPKDWWRARLINFGGCLSLLSVLPVGFELLKAGFNLWMVFSTALLITLAGGSLVVWYELRVYRSWIYRIIEHDGRMCPQCAYPLSGIQTQPISITCPECGYLTQDATRLFERWHNSVKSFHLQDDKRLRNHRNKQPND